VAEDALAAQKVNEFNDESRICFRGLVRSPLEHRSIGSRLKLGVKLSQPTSTNRCSGVESPKDKPIPIAS
jgi:hypothetical protein